MHLKLKVDMKHTLTCLHRLSSYRIYEKFQKDINLRGWHFASQIPHLPKTAPPDSLTFVGHHAGPRGFSFHAVVQVFKVISCMVPSCSLNGNIQGLFGSTPLTVLQSISSDWKLGKYKERCRTWSSFFSYTFS